jgi:hypothetical protein
MSISQQASNSRSRRRIEQAVHPATQQPLAPVLAGDVARHQHHRPAQRRVGVERTARLQHAVAGVGVTHTTARRHHLAGLRPRARQRSLHQSHVVAVDQRAHVEAKERLGRVAERVARRGVDVADAAGFIQQGEDVVGLFGQQTEIRQAGYSHVDDGFIHEFDARR